MEILLVETSPPQHYSWIGDHLFGLGYEVTTIGLDTVVNVSQERVWPLTILAVASPNFELSLLCRHLKSLPKNSQQMIFVVIESQSSPSAFFQSLLNAGVDDYICQPFSREEFTMRLTAIERQFYRLSQLQTTIHHLTTTEQKRKRTEEALRESMEGALRKNWEFFENLSNSLADAIITVKLPEQVVEYANSAVEEIFGYGDIAYVGKTLQVFFPDLAGYHEFTRELHDAMEHGRNMLRAEYSLRRKNGECFTAEITTTFLHENPDSIRMINIVRDITERKQMELALEQERASLAQKVEERTAELQRTNTELARAARHKDTFLANMSHELRTPLNAILGYARILRKSVNLTPLQREGLETIQSSGEHLLQLINDILDLAKIEAGRLELNIDQCYLPECLERVASMMRIRAAHETIVFRYVSDSNLPDGVYADEKRLREVLINLLENAVKFTERGSVTLRVRRGQHNGQKTAGGQEPETPYSLLPTAPLFFEVEDTGIGIAPTELENIFSPFQQVGEQQFTREGTGLGLSISRQLVTMMGGELRVKSRPGHGSTFWFELEVPEIPNYSPPLPSQHPKIAGYEGSQRTIMVVDDQHENRAILKTILLPLGFDVLEASNGQECLELFRVHRPDMVLLDLLMPIMDGFETARRIRAESVNKPVKIVAISASVFEEKRRESLAAGCDDFLHKPLEESVLLECLRTSLKLEWVYRYDNNNEVSVDTLPPSLLTSDIVYPSSDLEDLYTFAVCGNITKLLRRLEQIEELDAQYQAFVDELRRFAKSFQVKKILAYLEALQHK